MINDWLKRLNEETTHNFYPSRKQEENADKYKIADLIVRRCLLYRRLVLICMEMNRINWGSFRVFAFVLFKIWYCNSLLDSSEDTRATLKIF